VHAFGDRVQHGVGVRIHHFHDSVGGGVGDSDLSDDSSGGGGGGGGGGRTAESGT